MSPPCWSAPEVDAYIDRRSADGYPPQMRDLLRNLIPFALTLLLAACSAGSSSGTIGSDASSDVVTEIEEEITSVETPETLEQEIEDAGPVVVEDTGPPPATAAERIPMVPLLLTPHDWQVLDANTGMFSTRYAIQHSCMGLYPRYFALGREGRGAWFGARTDRGLLVGLSTARLDRSGQCQVDGFVHQNASADWENLLQAAVRWGIGQGAPLCRARLSVEDEEKRSRFESLKFHATGTGEAFDLYGRQVASIRLERRP